MTDITLEEEQVPTDEKSFNLLVNAIKLLLMAILLSVSVYMLHWVITDKLEKFEPAQGSSVTAAVRERQLNCLAKNIYYEAGNEPFEGKVAVAQVTLNRVESGKFPEDICKTIYQKNIFYEKVVCQFSWTCDRDSLRPPSNAGYLESMEVAKKVLLENFRLPALKDALYYHADYVNPGWRKEKIAKIGRHIFYK